MNRKIVALICLILLANNIYSQKSNCQLYNLIVSDIQNQFLNGTVDSIPTGQKIDPYNPQATKTYKVKRPIYLDLYISQNLLPLESIDRKNWAIQKLSEKCKIGNLKFIERPSLNYCFKDSTISSRFVKSTNLVRFNESDYRTEIINGQQVLLNPIRITFSNILFTDNNSAIVYLETMFGINFGVTSYYFIFKKVKGNWVVENRAFKTF